MSGLLLPTATMGVAHRVGEIMSSDGKSGVVVFVRGNLVAMRTMRNGEVVGHVEFAERQAEQIATFFKSGADMLSRQGGSGLPDTRTVPAAIAGE